MLFYEAMEHPKKDLSSTRRPSDTSPMSPITSDGDKLSQLQVQDAKYIIVYIYVEIVTLSECCLSPRVQCPSRHFALEPRVPPDMQP